MRADMERNDSHSRGIGKGQNLRGGKLRLIAFSSLLLAVSAWAPGLGFFSRSIWYDEALTLLHTAGAGNTPEYAAPVRADDWALVFRSRAGAGRIVDALANTSIHPPLYYLILGVLWRPVIGFSLEAVRVFSLLCSLLNVLFLFLLLRRAKVRGNWLVCLLFAFSPAFVYFAHEARNYALGSCLLTAGALFLYISADTPVERRKAWGWATLGGLSLGAAFLTHYLTAFVGFAVLVWFVLVSRRSLRIGLVPLVLAGTCVAAGLPILQQQIAARSRADGSPGRVTAHPRIAVSDAVQGSLENLCGWHSLPGAYKSGAGIYLAGLLFSSLVFLCFFRSRHEQSRLVTLAAGSFFISIVSMILLSVFFDSRLASPRYLMFGGPAAVLLVAVPVLSCSPKCRVASMIVLLPLIALQIRSVRHNLHVYRHGFSHRAVADEIAARSTEDAIVFIGRSNGGGNVAATVYALPGWVDVQELNPNSCAETAFMTNREYTYLWLVRGLGVTEEIENQLIRQIERSGLFVKEAVLNRGTHAEYAVGFRIIESFVPPDVSPLNSDQVRERLQGSDEEIFESGFF